MSGLFASLSAGRALEKLSSFLRAFSAPPPVPSSSSVQDDLEELRKLERTLHRIRATLHDAEVHWNIREESAKLRLKELKEVAYEMEDVVDEYEYEVNRCKAEALQRSACSAHYTGNGKRKHREKAPPWHGLPGGQENGAYPVDVGIVAVPYELVLRTRKITERFNEIIHYADNFSLSENDGERRFTPDISRSRLTSSFVSEKSIVGRDQLRDTIVEKLLSGAGQNVGKPVSVMAIVGMGGLGKTTLAQLVYNDPRVCGSFDRRAYVYVSENFDVITITRNIINSIIAQDKELRQNSELNELHGQYSELNELHGMLAYVMKERRILVVLDDLWNDKKGDLWESLCAPMSAARFCQIILTTRSKAVASLAQATTSYYPSCLSLDVSWSLFKQVAFQVDQESDAPVNLIQIGKSIAQKCKGLPLAIKIIGSMLRCETDEERWKDVLESELWDLEPSQHEILPALELSYKHMPIYLRRCFLALSLFPKVSSLGMYDVIQSWKVLDLLRCDGSEEKIGGLYLNELVQRSILVGEGGGQYFLHDLIHDLACFLAGEEFYRFGGGTSTEIIPQNVRYMSVTCDITPMEIQITSHSLRAIIVETFVNNPEALLFNCKKLRALDFSCHAEAFPVIIDSPKLLRHLSARVSGSAQFVMPTSMLRLYNLQTLELLWYNGQTMEMFFT